MTVATMNFAFVGSSDLTAPIAALVSESRTLVSLVAGRNSTDVVWTPNEDAQAWQFRVVPDATTPPTGGTLIKQGTGSFPANVEQTTNITAAEVNAASAGEGDKIVKLFVQDLAGNWSDTVPSGGGGGSPVIPDYRAIILADSPDGYWRLGETTGTTAASEVGSFPGTIGSAITKNQPGAIAQVNPSMLFPGIGSVGNVTGQVQGGNAFGYTGSLDFSIEAWIYPTTVDAVPRVIFAKYNPSGAADGYLFTYHSTQGLALTRRTALTNHVATTAAPPLNTWSHVVATFANDTDTLAVWVNGDIPAPTAGNFNPSDAGISALTADTTPWNIGNRNDGAWGFAGGIDEVAVYGRTLTRYEITRHYAAGIGG